MISSRIECAERSSRSATGAKTIIILTLVFPPDPASVGQHMNDVASEMAQRGYRVIVYTSNRGYDDPSVRYPTHEINNGVEIRRLPFSSFGKKSFALRVGAACSFTLQASLAILFTRRIDCILVSTAPPLCGIAAVVARVIRSIPYVYWMMDLNPDQLIALETLKARSVPAVMLESINRMILTKASLVVALDRFMARRLETKAHIKEKLRTIAPWPHEKHLDPVEHHQNPFRSAHGLNGKFVFMYSGNHSASNPLSTILDAAIQLQDDPEIMFVFIGGGLEKIKIENAIRDYNLANVISLPYQPLNKLRYSLSAADIHIVSLGKPFAGIVHPCKVYGAMACARPILFLGPSPSHVTDILDNHCIGWHIQHDDIDRAVEVIHSIRATSPTLLAAMGTEARNALSAHFSQEALCSEFCNSLEMSMGVVTEKATAITNGVIN